MPDAPQQAPDAPAEPAAILARGAARGEALDDFGPVWATARLRLARAGWQAADLSPFLNLDVPYVATSSGRLSADAVAVALAARPGATGLRILELGAGSGVFARLFLMELRRAAPEVYAGSSYLVTDGSASVLAAQAASGVLADHEAVVTRRLLDLTGDDWPDAGGFDVILGTYVLDSLPFDLLTIRDQSVWRKEARTVLDVPPARPADLDALRTTLAADDAGALAGLAWLGPRTGLQTRHVPVDRAALPWREALPDDTGGEALPFVHCHGALDCLTRAADLLAPGGVMIFSDYGHITPFTAHDTAEFQGYGTSVAVGLNFPQIARAMAGRDDLRLLVPEEEEGRLCTRVLQKQPLGDLQPLVDDLYGRLRQRALSAPVEAAQEVLRARMFETARGFYLQALARDPQNWALMQEITLRLLLPAGEAQAAADMARAGLALNPLSPDLWRALAEADLACDRIEDARTAAARAADLAPRNIEAQMIVARVALAQGDHGAALQAIARGLANDREAEARDELLALQQQVLIDQAHDALAALRAQANAFRGLDDGPPPD